MGGVKQTFFGKTLVYIVKWLYLCTRICKKIRIIEGNWIFKQKKYRYKRTEKAHK